MSPERAWLWSLDGGEGAKVPSWCDLPEIFLLGLQGRSFPERCQHSELTWYSGKLLGPWGNNHPLRSVVDFYMCLGPGWLLGPAVWNEGGVASSPDGQPCRALVVHGAEERVHRTACSWVRHKPALSGTPVLLLPESNTRQNRQWLDAGGSRAPQGWAVEKSCFSGAWRVN